MFKKRKSRSLSLKKPKRKNRTLLWSIAVIFVILLSFLIYGTILYNDLYDSKTAGFHSTKEHIINQTSIVEIFDVELFHGAEAYHVVYGINDQDEEKIIFLPLEGKERSITTVDVSSILSKEQVVDVWQSECNTCTFIDVAPALIDEKALWEIAYRNEQNSYALAYYAMDDAAKYEQLLFKSMFN